MKRILPALLLGVSLGTAEATIYQYMVNLDGPSEPSPSLGIGTGTVRYDDVARSLQLQVTFSGLTGTTTAAHIHAATASPFTGTAGVASTTPSFAGFPNGVTGGAFSNTLDLTLSTSWNASYVTANGGTLASAEAALATAMADGKAYWNIHTTAFPGGEIRGFLVAVPEPSALALVGMGGLGIWARFFPRRRP